MAVVVVVTVVVVDDSVTVVDVVVSVVVVPVVTVTDVLVLVVVVTVILVVTVVVEVILHRKPHVCRQKSCPPKKAESKGGCRFGDIKYVKKKVRCMGEKHSDETQCTVYNPLKEKTAKERRGEIGERERDKARRMAKKGACC